jgi:hypothetical protein
MLQCKAARRRMGTAYRTPGPNQRPDSGSRWMKTQGQVTSKTEPHDLINFSIRTLADIKKDAL